MRQGIYVLLLAGLFLTLQGCWRGGVDRQDLSGKVSYKGEPVPYGAISFRPDRSKGGSGPAGFARIEDGEYSTRGSGRGAIAGPVKVMIEGAISKEPLAPALFPIYITDIDVSTDESEVDFEVPEDAPRRSRR